ncbi:MAG: thioredoxin-dependent thiol peroxidase [Chloroflexota bacterium]|nr:thioredoxin-dependent thiol peroxidase [Chloroflexota bacterium]
MAPEFSLPNERGETVSLSDLRGRKVVLYFYPKDDTAGCTAEACGIRDQFPRFEARDAVVLGVSPDDSDSHSRFRAKYNLPFSQLADTDHHVAEAYGAWGTKKSFGKEHTGVLRTTFLIDEEGRIERVFEQVSPAEHAHELLEALSG